MYGFQIYQKDMVGPHWDVEHPDGNYDNIVPGGKIRGQK